MNLTTIDIYERVDFNNKMVDFSFKHQETTAKYNMEGLWLIFSDLALKNVCFSKMYKFDQISVNTTLLQKIAIFIIAHIGKVGLPVADGKNW